VPAALNVCAADPRSTLPELDGIQDSGGISDGEQEIIMNNSVV
jgi:hypothetical protein